MKNDRFRKNRDGKVTIYTISCSNCGIFLFKYQKDGIGSLKRFYADRIIDKPFHSKIICANCNQLIANYTLYKPENRPAFAIKPGSISKSCT